MAELEKILRGNTIGENTVNTNSNFTKLNKEIEDVSTKVGEIEEQLEDVGKVDDVRVNNGSIVTNKVANIPLASSTDFGLVRVFNDTIQTVDAITTSSTSKRTYGVQKNATNKLVVNVPWENTTYSASDGLSLNNNEFSLKTATSSGIGGVAIGYEDFSSETRNYAVKLDSDNKAYVNVPWTDNDTTYSGDTGIILSGNTFKAALSSETKGTVSSTYSQGTSSSKFYSVQMDKDGKLAVNVPWTDNNTNTAHAHTAGVGLVLSSGSGGISGTTTYKVDIKNETVASEVSAYTKGDDASRFYAVQLDSEKDLAVNVPWTDTTYTCSDGITLNDNEFKLTLSNSALAQDSSSYTAGVEGRFYSVQLDSDGNLAVYVPWVDTNTTYSSATNNTLGLVKPLVYHSKASTGAKASSDSNAISVNNATSASGRYYPIESDSNGSLFVNVPWEDGGYLTACVTNNTYSKLYIIGSNVFGEEGDALVDAVTYTNTNVYIQGNELYSNGKKVATSEELTKAIDGISGGLYFKGTLGTNGTITELPDASNSTIGYMYKVITAGTYGGIVAEVGDLIIGTSTEWLLVPSGDDGDVYADNNFVNDKFIVADGNQKKVKSSAYSIDPYNTTPTYSNNFIPTSSQVMNEVASTNDIVYSSNKEQLDDGTYKYSASNVYFAKEVYTYDSSNGHSYIGKKISTVDIINEFCDASFGVNKGTVDTYNVSIISDVDLGDKVCFMTTKYAL